MPRVDILSGIYTSAASDFRTSYPRNLVPIAMDTKMSKGYLRPAEGVIEFGEGPGVDRGGINWNNVCYRVMGTKLISLTESGVISILGDVGVGFGAYPNEQCSFTYSFDRLAIASGRRLYYWDGVTLTQVTDPDLGEVVDVVWIDGYFMTTDGTYLVVTELNDPFSVNPFKYGSSEVDPDPVEGLIKIKDEIYALNRYTTEVFQDIGGSVFPFQRINGALAERGCVGTYAKALFLESVAFIGGGRNEPPAVWLASNGSSLNISTREIDEILSRYTETQLSTAVLESRVNTGQKLLYIHLVDQTLVYDGAASQLLQQPIWYFLTSGVALTGTYRARNFIWCYNRWIVGDPTSNKYGYLSDTVSSHYGDTNDWEFSTPIIYNESNGAIFSEMELVCLTGRLALGDTSTLWTSYSTDGLTWSQEKPRTLGRIGDYNKRITWYQQGFMRNWRVQRFRGTSDAHLTISHLEMDLEPLNG